METRDNQAAGAIPRRLFPYAAGLWNPRLRRILTLAGHQISLGLPGPQDGVLVWGHSPHAWRGEAVAARRNVPLIRVEDALLRSIRPGRMGDAPIGLLIDSEGVHFDSATPSRLERILTSDPLDDSALLTRAKQAMARIQALDLSKYNLHDTDLPPPAPGYVLVIDQTQGDASIRHSGANAARFAEMLTLAQLEHPTARILIKTHPETQIGLRGGHFGPPDAKGRVTLCTQALSPWRLLEGAIAVYTVSSQMGFEAILAGHRPIVLGQPFYAGWGLSDDRFPIDRRRRKLTRAQLFAAAMILAPTWYDPCLDRLCSLEEVINQLEAEVRAYRCDRNGHVASGMRLWKRARLQDFFGRQKPLIFCENQGAAVEVAARTNRNLMVWAGKAPQDLTCLRVEDGFLRSRGLGAELVPPLSLVVDDLGIYYDPIRESRLERLIRTPLPPAGADRAEALAASLIALRISKYNLPGMRSSDPNSPLTLPVLGSQAPGDLLAVDQDQTQSDLARIEPVRLLPLGQDRTQPTLAHNEPVRLLVPGQVEDDASLRFGAGQVCTNLALLQRARAAHPQAHITYKPHPDVEAGLRAGAISEPALQGLADVVAQNADPIALIAACDAVWTMTSLLGFEALVRGKPVTCLGAPFYAGWGLTTDLGPVPKRRLYAPDDHPLPRITLAQLIHATLIAYPRYYDPITRRPCPPEVAVVRLASGGVPQGGLALRLLAKAQGAFASKAHLWR